jgi:hypothetical protein
MDLVNEKTFFNITTSSSYIYPNENERKNVLEDRDIYVSNVDESGY